MWAFLSLLSILALPFGCLALDSGGTDVGTQVNHVVPEGFQESDKANLQTRQYLDVQVQKRAYVGAAPLDPSLQMAYFPGSAFRGAIRAFAPSKPSPSDFWERASKAEKILQDYVPRLLESAGTYFKSESNKFTEVMDAMNRIVNDTATFRENIQSALNACHVTLDAFGDDLDGIFMGIVDDLKKFPSSDRAPGHAEREQMVGKVLDDTTQALKKLCAQYGIEEEAVTAYLNSIKPHLQALIVAVGDINEQHPLLLPTLAFSIAVLLIPESWFLRPFLSLFGFGPMGPVKGSAAALLQTRFWGAAVESGSWFSFLQAAGMGVVPGWAGLVTKLPLLVGGLMIPLTPCYKRG